MFVQNILSVYRAQDDDHNNYRANQQDRPATRQYLPNHTEDNTEILAKPLDIVLDKVPIEKHFDTDIA